MEEQAKKAIEELAKKVMQDKRDFQEISERGRKAQKALKALVKAIDELPEGHRIENLAGEIAENSEELMEAIQGMTCEWWIIVNGYKGQDEEE